jgi:hypothetical protein
MLLLLGGAVLRAQRQVWMVDCAAGLHENTVLRGSGQNETDIKSALESLMQSHQPLTFNKPEFSACLAEQNTM